MARRRRKVLIKVQGKLPAGVSTQFDDKTVFIGCFDPHLTNKKNRQEHLVLYFDSLESLRGYIGLVNNVNPSLSVEYIHHVSHNRKRVRSRVCPFQKDLTTKHLPSS